MPDIWIDDYGADPTGVKDSTTAFQTALSYCRTNYIYKLKLSHGGYRLTQSINVNGVVLEGYDRLGTLLQFYNMSPGAILIKNDASGSLGRSGGGLAGISVWAMPGTTDVVGFSAWGDSVNQPSEMRLEDVGFSALDGGGWFRYHAMIDGSARKSPFGIRRCFVKDVTAFRSSVASLYMSCVANPCVANWNSNLACTATGVTTTAPTSLGGQMVIAGACYSAMVNGLYLAGPIIAYHTYDSWFQGVTDGFWFDATSHHISGHIRSTLGTGNGWTNAIAAANSDIVIL